MRSKTSSNSDSLTRKAQCWEVIGGSASMKSRLTPLADATTMKGPYGVGAGKPRTSARKRAEASLSRAATMVWLSCAAMAVFLSSSGAHSGAGSFAVIGLQLLLQLLLGEQAAGGGERAGERDGPVVHRREVVLGDLLVTG